MTPNDALRSLRYTFDYDDSQMISIFGLMEHVVTRDLLSQWLKKDEDPAFKPCLDVELSLFLNGLIIEKRGKKEGPLPEPDKRITNNIVLKKLRIALDLKSEDVLALLKMAGLEITPSELTSFFRKPEHRNYRVCKNQVLRNFLKGLQLKYRPEKIESPKSSD